MVTWHEPANGELPACSYELVGVFDVKRVLSEFGAQVAADYLTNGNPREYWNGNCNGFTRSIVLKSIPGNDDERHWPTAVFVATASVNSAGNYPPRAELLAYREAYPCLVYDNHWSQWSDVVGAFTSAIEQKATAQFHVQRNAGHPWDSTRKGFDLMTISAETQTELASAVKSSEGKFWQPWLVGANDENGKPVGVMYKPCDIAAPWQDSPENLHPGCDPQEIAEIETSEKP